jgi:hypothetical protein
MKNLITITTIILVLISVNCNAQGKIKVKETLLNFDTLFQNDPANLKFWVYNVGNKPLIITKANTTCGCDMAEWPKHPIIPGDSAIIKYKYDSKRIGPINKSITIYSSDTSINYTVVKVKGNVLEKNIKNNDETEEVKTSHDSIYYHQNQQYYIFDLIGTHQYLYFDSATYDNNRPITLLIRNNTSDTVTISYKSLISSKVTFRENATRYIKPNEYYSLSPVFNEIRYHKQSLLSAHFEFSYSTPKQSNQVIFRLQGNIFLDTLPAFDLHTKHDFPIAKTPIPIKHPEKEILAELNQPEKKTEFIFRNELWVYPKSNKNSLPENLTLKYFIDNEEYFAKKRLDSLNRVYFKIPSKLGDSIYCVLDSPKHSFIAKKSFVRNQINELTFSFNLGAELNQPHYYDQSGKRVAIDEKWIGKYFLEFDLNYKKNIHQNKKNHLDSLNKIIRKYDAKLEYSKYDWPYGYILTCTPQMATKVCSKLGKYELNQMIGEMIYVNNTYHVFFDSQISKERAVELLKENNITHVEVLKISKFDKRIKMYNYYLKIKLNQKPCSIVESLIIECIDPLNNRTELYK